MTYYQCYLLNATDQVVSVDSLEADNVARAMALADHMIAKTYPGLAAVEVWHGAQCVGKMLRAVNKSHRTRFANENS